jgi:lipopolysaccharide/colanic/teichoic acid biosynthesis glycosyltransferase
MVASDRRLAPARDRRRSPLSTEELVIGQEPGATGAGQAAAGERLAAEYARMAHDFEVRPVDRALRAIDVALSAVLLAGLSPVLGACMVAVYASGGSPVIYRGARVGRAGRVFWMYKLRTLRPDAEQRLGPYLGEELTRLTESELTPVGRALRHTKLDELPQLWNVLRGDMSLVGPRPIRPTFFVTLCEEIPAYWQRLVVRPGVTGLAQLRLSREMTWAEKLVHDLEYIADRSVSLYMSVVAQTALLVVGRLLGRSD